MSLLFCIFYIALQVHLLFLFFYADLIKYNKGERWINPTGIDKFCELSASDRRQMAYYHPDVVRKVFLEGICELTVEASPVEITTLVTKSKVV